MTKPRKASLDWSKARLASFPNLKPSTCAISLRLPVSLLERVRSLEDVAGCLRYKGRPKTIREMDEAVQAEAKRSIRRR